MVLKCALCGSDVSKGFTNPKNHKPGCPIYVSTEEVAEVIVKKASKGQRR